METQEFISFFKENPVCTFATTDGNKPSVRPVQLMFEDNSKLYFCTANTKTMYKQMQANPNIELAVSSKDYKTTLRISGKAIFSKDFALRQRIANENAFVRSIYKTADNPTLEVLHRTRNRQIPVPQRNTAKIHEFLIMREVSGMFMIYSFRDGRRIREATTNEYSQYIKEVSKKSKDNQLTGEVNGERYGLKGLIYMQETAPEKAMGTKCEITYFDVAGRANSDETLKLAKERAIGVA